MSHFEECPISWKILHSNIKSPSERKIIEALEIQKHSDNIMNRRGCIGRNILPARVFLEEKNEFIAAAMEME